MPPDPLTTVEVARLLKVSPRTVHRLVDAEQLIPVQRLAYGKNGAYLFDPADVDTYKARTGSVA